MKPLEPMFRALLDVPREVGAFGHVLHPEHVCFVGGGGIGVDFNVPAVIGNFGNVLDVASSTMGSVVPRQLTWWWDGGNAADHWELWAAGNAGQSAFTRVASGAGVTGFAIIPFKMTGAKIKRLAGAGTPVMSLSY